MSKTCAACGKPKVDVSLGGTPLCRPCAADIEAEIEHLREKGESVSVANIARRIFRETHSAGNYLLRDIPEDLWNQAKHVAIDKGLSLRELLLEALRKYIQE